jgi:hypothetical protein
MLHDNEICVAVGTNFVNGDDIWMVERHWPT